MFDYIPKEILPLGFFFIFCSVIGTSGNLVMVMCSLRNKRFRSPSHVLITSICLQFISADISCFVFIFLEIVSGFYSRQFNCVTSTQAQCYYMLFIPTIGLTSGGPLILSLDIDRLIAVRYPTRYRCLQKEPNLYICAQLLFPIAYSVIFLIYGFLVRDTDINKQITCTIPFALNGIAFQMFTYSSGIIYVFVFIIYLTVYILLKNNKSSAAFKNIRHNIYVRMQEKVKLSRSIIYHGYTEIR